MEYGETGQGLAVGHSELQEAGGRIRRQLRQSENYAGPAGLLLLLLSPLRPHSEAAGWCPFIDARVRGRGWFLGDFLETRRNRVRRFAMALASARMG